MFGATCKDLGIEISATRNMFMFTTLKNMVAASVRLGRIGPLQVRHVYVLIRSSNIFISDRDFDLWISRYEGTSAPLTEQFQQLIRIHFVYTFVFLGVWYSVDDFYNINIATMHSSIFMYWNSRHRKSNMSFKVWSQVLLKGMYNIMLYTFLYVMSWIVAS